MKDKKTLYLLPIDKSGGKEMIKAELWHEIHSRFKLKEPKKSIARSLGIDVRTVRKVLRQSHPQRYRRKKKEKTLLSGYEDYIRKRLPAVGYCAQSIFEELLEMGYRGGYDTVRRYIKPLREEALREATIRFETPPGKQSQVDWGQSWVQLGSRSSRVHLFALTLGYSRRFFAQGTSDEKLATFLECHLKAFDHFGGLTHEILYDNTKSVVLERDFEGRKIRWNSTFWDFSRYYGFRPKVHQPYRPQTKGKVESSIKYVKRFLRGKVFVSLDHLNECLLDWILSTADYRVHGTTHRRPIDMFGEEKELLISHWGKPPYALQHRVIRHVAKDCLVSFQTNRYSVPHRFVGQQVEVQSDHDFIRIYHQGELIALHPRLEGKYQVRCEPAHYQGIFNRRQQERTFYLVQNSQEEVEVRDLAFYESLVEGGSR